MPPSTFQLSASDDLLAVGRFGRTRGVRGWILVHSLAGQVADLASYNPWYLPKDGDGGFVELKPQDKKLEEERLYVRLDGCDCAEQAQRYVNQLIYVSKKVLPLLEKGEYYWHELTGLAVYGLDGYLGMVQELFTVGPHDVMVVVRDGRRLLIPYVDAIVKNVSLPQKRIEVDWASDYL